MNQENLKLLVKHLEIIVESLKSEVYSDTSDYNDKRENFDDPPYYYGDYDEVFDDNSFYPE